MIFTRFYSLRVRLLALVLLMVVPWLLLMAYTQADERKAAIANVNDDAMRLIRIVTSNQAAQVEAARQLLTAFARLPQLHTKDAAACNAFLAEMLKAYPLYFNIAVADPNGNLFCSALPFKPPINVADRAYFKMAIQTARLRDRRLSDRPRHAASRDQLCLPAAGLVGTARRRRLRGAELELADDGSRERRVSAGRYPGGDRSQWNGARPHARCRRLDRQVAARSRRSWRSCSARRMAASSKPTTRKASAGCGPTRR